ncbi:MAG: TonB-dependent receptor, partial [Ignavibacteria bacterium]|nr:TonB-dependent receptor [Ignavibacteria bacterium]
MNTHVRIVGVVFFMLTLAGILIAGNTGKIVGRVADKGNGEPIIGANVLVVGTQRGSVTDIDGKFTIIGVPVGSQTVRASQVGFTTVEFTDVKIGADETTQLNFQLSSSEVIIGGVTTTADAKLVNSNVTTGTVNVSAKSIESIPNVKSVEDVLKLQAGVVKQGNNLFLRGGRANEVQYLVDGVPTNNIVGNSGELVATNSANAQLQQLYAGVQSGVIGGGASGLALSANSIQSVSVQTSGFDADYGNAQSGIINITTKSGGEKFTGSMQYRTDRVANTNQNEYYSAFSVGGPEPLSKYVLPGLGAKIPGNLTFFLSADADRADGVYNYVHNDFYNPVERKIQLDGFLGGLLNGMGFKFRDNQKNSFTFNSKLKYDISGNDQVSYGYRASLTSKHDYYNDWKYRADSSALGAGLSIQHNLSWQHFFTSNSFIRMYLAKNENKDGNDVAGIKPTDYSSATEKLDVNNDGFNDLATSQRWYNSLTKVWSFRVDLNSQVHPLHLLKTGFEFNLESVNSTEILNPTKPFNNANGDQQNPPNPDLRYSRGDYPGYGEFRWNINNYSNRGGLYVQDNIEFSGLNLHMGLRYDYLDIGRQVYYQDYVDAWKAAYDWRDSIEGAPNPPWVEALGFDDKVAADGSPIKVSRGLSDSKRFFYYLFHGNFSPRLSIGYPVTDRIVFYFNYGHFLQYPDRDNYYRDPFVASKGSTFGSPSLKPQRTVAYEAGFEDQFADDLAFAIHAFYKDIFDLATVVSRGDYQVYRNLDYASARGFEITLNQALTGNFSTSVSYSYQIAKGRSSNPLASIYQPQFQLPRET